MKINYDFLNMTNVVKKIDIIQQKFLTPALTLGQTHPYISLALSSSLLTAHAVF